MPPPEERKPSLLERLGNALVYVLAFPFIAVFIGLSRVFTQRKQPARSYRQNLPQQRYLGKDK